MEARREFAFTSEDFDHIRSLVFEQSGISLADHKRQLVYGRLTRRLRELNLQSFSQYCDLLKESNSDEVGLLVNAITTNVTSFFRESHHFDFVADTLIPALLDSGAQRLRIWSAGCSSGEEPYSIAMTLAKALSRSRMDAKVLATDIDAGSIETAMTGVYPVEKVEAIDKALRQNWFERGQGAQQGNARAKQRLKDWIRFAFLNLMGEWPMNGPFDAVFCRNVVIYFDRPTKMRLFDRFADILKPGGYLFLGHSESMHGLSNRFELIGRTVYRKVN